VERPGYKTEYSVAFPMEKLLEIKCEHRLASDSSEFKTIAIAYFDSENSDYGSIQCVGLPYSEYRKNSFLNVEAPTLCKKEFFRLPIVKLDLEDVISNAFFETGFVDSSESMLSYRNHNNFIDVEVQKMRIYVLSPSSKNCQDYSVFMDAEIKMEIYDRFHLLKGKASTSSRSGIYSLGKNNWFSSDSLTVRAPFVDMLIKDVFANGFLDFIGDTSEVKIAGENEPLLAAKMSLLTLKSTNYVKDLKTAMLATVSIKSDDSFGSGCIVSNDGYILTSCHVIADNLAKKKDVKVILAKGDTLNGVVVRTSRMADLALIKTNGNFPFAFKITSIPEFEVADQVFAIGTPSSLELSQTVSRGIISGVREENGLPHLIQIDVSVNPGNSGGPLFKSPDVFLGVVNSKIYGRRVEGLGFCTPSENVIKYLKVETK